MLYLKQSTASQSVIIGPFVDSTDGATAETGLTISNTDIRLSKNGGNLAAKNSGGGTHDENGWYTITLDATDTNTVGTLQLHVNETGALQVFAEFQILEETVFDALFGASAPGYLQPTVAARTLDVTAGGTAGIDWGNVENLTTTNVLSNTTVGTTTANTDMRGTDSASTASALATVDTNVDSILVDTGTTIPAQISGLNDVAATDIVSAGAITTLSGAIVNVDLVDTTTANTDMRGTDSAALATALATAQLDLDTITGSDGALIASSEIAIKKNTALANFEFLMTDDTNHAPSTGLTVTGTRSIDGAAFGALANSVSEVASGIYKVNLAAADLNGDVITLRFTATSTDDRLVTIVTQT